MQKRTRIEIRYYHNGGEPLREIFDERKQAAKWSCLISKDGKLSYEEVTTSRLLSDILEALSRGAREWFAEVKVFEDGRLLYLSDEGEIVTDKLVDKTKGEGKYEIAYYREGETEPIRKVYIEKKRPQKWHCVTEYRNGNFYYDPVPPSDVIASVLDALSRGRQSSPTEVVIDGELVFFNERGILIRRPETMKAEAK